MKFTGIGTQVLCSFEWLTVMSFERRNNFCVRSLCAFVYQERKIRNIKVKFLCPRGECRHSFTHS